MNEGESTMAIDKITSNGSMLKRLFGVLLLSVLISFLLSTIYIKPLLAVSSPVPDPPTMSSGTCEAVVTYSWDVSDIPNANRVLWELKKGSDFQNNESPDNGSEVSGTSNNLNGSVTIDLRDYGQVLNRTEYYFRVVARNGNQDVARWSDSVSFNLQYIPNPNDSYSATASEQNPFQVSFTWNLPNEITDTKFAILR
jgi:hypothetical protein